MDKRIICILLTTFFLLIFITPVSADITHSTLIATQIRGGILFNWDTSNELYLLYSQVISENGIISPQVPANNPGRMAGSDYSYQFIPDDAMCGTFKVKLVETGFIEYSNNSVFICTGPIIFFIYNPIVK